MSFIFIGILIAFVFIMLLLSGVLPVKEKKNKVDITSELRNLLLARAEGKIEQEEFERRQAALHLTIIDSPNEKTTSSQQQLSWAIPVIIAVLALAVSIYVVNGKPKDAVVFTPMSSSRISVQPAPSPTETSTQSATPKSANSGGDLSTAVKHLESKMQKNPNNGDGWLLLARSYGELRQPKEAAEAYAKAAALLPPDATLLADWVDARVVANNRTWDKESRDILKRALAINPKHVKTLALSGSEAFERTDYQQAITFWKQVIAVAPVDSMEAKLAEKNSQEASALLKGKK